MESPDKPGCPTTLDRPNILECMFQKIPGNSQAFPGMQMIPLTTQELCGSLAFPQKRMESIILDDLDFRLFWRWSRFEGTVLEGTLLEGIFCFFHWRASPDQRPPTLTESGAPRDSPQKKRPDGAGRTNSGARRAGRKPTSRGEGAPRDGPRRPSRRKLKGRGRRRRRPATREGEEASNLEGTVLESIGTFEKGLPQKGLDR